MTQNFIFSISNSTEQLKALSYQISKLTQSVSNHPGWKLKDIFIDVHTSTVGSTREQFLRLMNDARIGLIDIVLSTTISRFGRDSVEVLSSLNSLHACDVRVIFENDGLDSYKTGSSFLTDIYAASLRLDLRFAYSLQENASLNVARGDKTYVTVIGNTSTPMSCIDVGTN